MWRRGCKRSGEMTTSTSASRFWLIASGAAFLVTLVSAALFIAFADRISFIPPAAYYILLMPLGAAAAAFLFGAMRSYAKYSGKVVYGTLELGGPVVVFALVVVGGYYVASAQDTFDLTVRVHGPEGPAQIIRQGSITAHFDGNALREEIDSDGQARFLQIPARFRAQPVTILPDVAGFRAADAGPFDIPPNGVGVLPLERVPDSTTVRGTVLDRDGRTVAGARLSFRHGLATATSNDVGEFTVTLPAAAGERLPLIITLDGQVVYDNVVVVEGESGYRLQIEGGPE